MQLFIQFIYLNGSACIAFGTVASGMATATASVVGIEQLMQSIKSTTPNASYTLNTESFINGNHVDCAQFNGIIANGMHSDNAANNNQQMIIQSKQTDRQQQQQQPL